MTIDLNQRLPSLDGPSSLSTVIPSSSSLLVERIYTTRPPLISTELIFDTINIRGLRDPLRRIALTDYLRSTPAHGVVVSENNLDQTQLRAWLNYDGPGNDQWIAHAFADEHVQGVAVLLRKQLDARINGVEWHSKRLVRLRIGFRRHVLALIACYYPSGSDTRVVDGNARAQTNLVRKIKEWVEECVRNQDDYALTGDLNGCLDPSLERRSVDVEGSIVEHTSTDPENALLQYIATSAMFVDPWREIYPDDPGFTRQGESDGRISFARLQYFVTSSTVLPLVQQVTVIRNPPGLSVIMPQLDHDVLRTTIETDRYMRYLGVGQCRSKRPPPSKRLDERRIGDEDWRVFRESTLQAMSNAGGDNVDHVDSKITTAIRAGCKVLPQRTVGNPSAPKEHQFSTIYAALKFLSTATLREVASGRRSREDLVEYLRRRFGKLDGIWTDHLQRYQDPRHFAWGLADRLRRLERTRLKASADLARLEYQIVRDTEFRSNIRRYLPALIGRSSSFDALDIVHAEDGVEDEPAAVLELVRSAFINWTPPAQEFSLDAHPEWAVIYDASDNAPMLECVTRQFDLEELKREARSLASFKAPGASGIQAAAVKQALDVIGETVVELFNLCLEQRRLPKSWCVSLIQPIPKPGATKGDLTKLRPIALLETLRKLFSRIITTRMSDALQNSRTLSDLQVGFTRGMQGPDAVLLVRSAIDFCNRERKRLYVVSFDIRRAFDSVSCSSLLASLRRFRIPEVLCDIIASIYEMREARVRTAHGLTDPHHPNNGLDQGDTMSPLLWVIFYDALLRRLQDSGLGAELDMDANIRDVPGALPRVIIPATAAADDLTLLATSKTDMIQLIAIVDSFLLLHGITCNGEKSVIAANCDPSHPDFPEPAEMQSSPGRPVSNLKGKTEPFRLLGTLLRMDGKSTNAVAQMKLRASNIMSALAPRRISSEITVYVMNAVLVPAVAWRAWGQALSDSDVDAIEASYRSQLKHKLSLPRTMPNSFIYARSLYGVRSLADTIDSNNISLILRLLNMDTPASQVLRQNIRSLQRQYGWDRFPLASRIAGKPILHDFLRAVHGGLSTRGLTIQPATAELSFARPLNNSGPPLELVSSMDATAEDYRSVRMIAKGKAERLFDTDSPEYTAMLRSTKRKQADYPTGLKTPKRQRVFARNWDRISPRHKTALLHKATLPLASWLAWTLQDRPTHRQPDELAPTTTPEPTDSIFQYLDSGIPATPRRKRGNPDPAERCPIKRVCWGGDAATTCAPVTANTREDIGQVDGNEINLHEDETVNARPSCVILTAKRPIRYLREAVSPRRVQALTPWAMTRDAERQLANAEFWQCLHAVTSIAVFTDGSVIGGRGGYSVVINVNDTWHSVVGGYDGPAVTSNRLEALAILHAICLVPSTVELRVLTDSLVGVNAFKSFITDRMRLLVGKRMQHPDAVIWGLVHNVVKCRAAPVVVEYIPGHSGIIGNEMADVHAKRAAQDVDQTTWNVLGVYGREQRFTLCINGFRTTRPATQDLADQAKFVRESDLDLSIRSHLPPSLQSDTIITKRLELETLKVPTHASVPDEEVVVGASAQNMVVQGEPGAIPPSPSVLDPTTLGTASGIREEDEIADRVSGPSLLGRRTSPATFGVSSDAATAHDMSATAGNDHAEGIPGSSTLGSTSLVLAGSLPRIVSAQGQSVNVSLSTDNHRPTTLDSTFIEMREEIEGRVIDPPASSERPSLALAGIPIEATTARGEKPVGTGGPAEGMFGSSSPAHNCLAAVDPLPRTAVVQGMIVFDPLSMRNIKSVMRGIEHTLRDSEIDEWVAGPPAAPSTRGSTADGPPLGSIIVPESRVALGNGDGLTSAMLRPTSATITTSTTTSTTSDNIPVPTTNDQATTLATDPATGSYRLSGMSTASVADYRPADVEEQGAAATTITSPSEGGNTMTGHGNDSFGGDGGLKLVHGGGDDDNDHGGGEWEHERTVSGIPGDMVVSGGGEEGREFGQVFVDRSGDVVTDGEREREDPAFLWRVYQDNNKRRRLRREQQSQRCSFHIKLLRDCLPTMVRQAAWRPWMGVDSTCKRCLEEEETRDHLRRCVAIATEVKEKFDRVFVDAVMRVTRRPVRTRRWIGIMSSGLDWLLYVDWIFLGVVPICEVGSLARIADISEAKSKIAILAGLANARDVFLDDVWRARCKATIRWERTNGITAAAKRAPRPDGWTPTPAAEPGLATVSGSGGLPTVLPTPDSVARPHQDGSGHVTMSSEMRDVHPPVDKRRDRWKAAGERVISKVWGEWKLRAV